MDYLKTFLMPFLKDKAVWVTLFSWALTLVNTKLHLGLNADLLTTLSSALSVSTLAHLSHAKWAGGDGKAPTDEELKGKDPK